MGLLHVAINVSDVNASVEFYRTVLGMTQIREETDGVHQIWVGRDEESEIQLREVGSDGPVGPTGAHHFAITVDDLDNVCRSIDASDIEMEPTTFPSHGTRGAFIRDPDGYAIELIQEIE